MQDPNIELVDDIVVPMAANKMPIREYYLKKPFKMCYVEDPFGCV
jgi:hypothetical protein